jgi:hypothetical protein
MFSHIAYCGRDSGKRRRCPVTFQLYSMPPPMYSAITPSSADTNVQPTAFVPQAGPETMLSPLAAGPHAPGPAQSFSPHHPPLPSRRKYHAVHCLVFPGVSPPGSRPAFHIVHIWQQSCSVSVLVHAAATSGELPFFAVQMSHSPSSPPLGQLSPTLCHQPAFCTAGSVQVSQAVCSDGAGGGCPAARCSISSSSRCSSMAAPCGWTNCANSARAG